MVIECGATSAVRGMSENGALVVSHEAAIGLTAASMRDSCDQLLDPSAAAALCLSAELLQALYGHFEAVGWSSVQSPSADADRFEAVGSVGLPDSRLLEDVQFLYDLVQLSPRLRLHADSCGPPSVQLVAFRCLELLELESVPVSGLHGLRRRRPYLRSLRCSGSCLLADGELAELLAHCGADRSSPLLWDELTELMFTCCPKLTRLDDSLKLLPRLRQLDLAHNRLENVQDLVHLNELQSVNLCFNDLTVVPTFSHVSCVTLSWLSLANNRLEFLNGLEDLVGLEHLDLGYNCLVSHALLWPLSELAKLRYLQLFGNPLCCISKHRVSTIRMLHDQCQTTQFVLDSRFVRRWEMSVRPLERLVRSSLRTVLLRRPPTPLVHARLPPKHPVESVDSTPASVRRRRFNKRRTRANIANISDMDGADGQSTTDVDGRGLGDGRDPAAAVNGDSCSLTLSSSLSLADVPSHLVTRDQIQNLRRELGAEDWLHSQGASMVQELLGLPQQPPPNFTIAGALDSDDGLIDAGYTPSSPQQNGLVHTPPTPTGSTPRPVSPSDGVYSRRTAAALQSQTSAKSIDGAAGTVDSSVYGRDTEEESESEDEENLCLVLARLIRKNSEQDIMLTVTPTSVKEKELDSARTSAEWDLQSVEACHVIRSDPLTVQLNFDTVRRDKRERNYTMEASEWKELRSVLSPIIEARLASELAANVLQCMKCNAEFSEGMAKTAVTLQDRNGGSFRHVKRCPNCDSDMIIHVEKMSHPNLDVTKSNNVVHLNAARQSRLKRRSSSKNMLSSTPRSVSSATNVASADGVSESASSQSPSEHSSGITVVAEIHTESSSISVLSDDPGDVTEHQSRGDSDVDVISNPSESSIEVLPDATRRFRPIASASHVLEPTVAEENGIKNGLPMEESSSSGSMSTSVTTVRERGSDVGGASPRRPDELTAEAWLCEEGDPPVELGRERLRFWPQDPRRCDHRIRLHLDLNVLQSSEQLSWLIQCTCGMDPDFSEFPCLLVVTNANLYLLEIAADSNVDVCSRLRVRVCHQLNSVSSFGDLFDQQGVSICFSAGAQLLVIVRDQRRGSRLMQLLQESCPDVSNDVSWLEAQSNMVQHMLFSDPSADAALQHVLRVDMISQSTQPESVAVPVMLCVTRSDMLLVDGLLRWLLPQNVTDKIPIRDQEKTANLSKLEILRSGIPAVAASGSSVGWTVRLTFVDPSGGTSGAESHSWLLQLTTRESVRYLVNSLQSVWQHSQSSGDDDAPQLPVTLV